MHCKRSAALSAGLASRDIMPGDSYIQQVSTGCRYLKSRYEHSHIAKAYSPPATHEPLPGAWSGVMVTFLIPRLLRPIKTSCCTQRTCTLASLDGYLAVMKTHCQDHVSP